MAIKFTISESSGFTVADTASVVVRAGICSGGVEGELVELAAGQDPVPLVGYGPMVADAAAASRLAGARQILLKVPATTPGTISAVTGPGGAPAITLAGTDFDDVTNSPFDAYDIKFRVAKTGPLGDCLVDVALDGATYAYTYDVPLEARPTLDGTVDLTGITLSTLNTKTLQLQRTAPLIQVDVTFTTPTDVYDIAQQINDQTADITASIVGGKYLRISYDVGGAAETLQVLAASTADTILGLSNTAAPGGPSTLVLPGTGLTATFAVGTRTKGHVYSATTTAPRHSLANLLVGLTALNVDPLVTFGMVHVVQLPVDATDLRSYVDAIDPVLTAWKAQENKRFVDYIIGAPLTATDSAVKAAMVGHVSPQGDAVVAPRYLFMQDVTPLPIGRFRRSLARALSIRLAAISLSEDPGLGELGPLPECSFKGPAGDLAPDEASAGVKLGTSKGPGFTVVKGKDGQPFFVRGVTRAGPTSRFVDVGVARMTARVAQLVYAALRTMENKTFDLMLDGTLQERDASAIEGAFSTMLAREIVRRKHASAIRVTVDRTEKVSDTRNITIEWLVQPRGQGEDMTGKVTLTGTIETTG